MFQWSTERSLARDQPRQCSPIRRPDPSCEGSAAAGRADPCVSEASDNRRPAMSTDSRADASDVRRADLDLCQAKIGYVFRDPQLLEAALTHASGVQHRLASNERMEFLGDAILGMVVCERLFHQYPEYSEGELTKIKSVVVSRDTCAAWPTPSPSTTT